jgi:hypothetical protein
MRLRRRRWRRRRACRPVAGGVPVVAVHLLAQPPTSFRSVNSPTRSALRVFVAAAITGLERQALHVPAKSVAFLSP